MKFVLPIPRAVLAASVLLLLATPVEAATEKVLYTFCGQQGCVDGAYPMAGLVDVNGTLYGTAYEGGANYFAGTLFSLNPKSHAETVLHTFGGAGDGQYPDTGLLAVKRTLYGATTQGGAYDFGAVYAFDLNTSTETVLHSFRLSNDGVYPDAGLIHVNGKLYGTTTQGGALLVGTVFYIDLRTGAEKVLYSFGGNPDGEFPSAPLLDVNGMLYGTTGSGGAHNGGTVFSFDPKTRIETVVYSFCGQQNCADGETPSGALIEVNGVLYGTTTLGGTGTGECMGCGTVFSLNLQSGAETVLHSFQDDGTDGHFPTGLIDVNGTFYGTTKLGGSYDWGAVFSVVSGTGAESVLYSFQNNALGGYSPNGGLISVHGALYGTTYLGGQQAFGTAFKIRP